MYTKNVTFLFPLHFDPPGSSIWIFFLTEMVSEDELVLHIKSPEGNFLYNTEKIEVIFMGSKITQSGEA